MSNPAAQPWYRRAVRWGQTNITEADAANYDIAWWRDVLAAHPGARRHHQRGRHRRLLPQPRPASTIAPIIWATATSLARSARPHARKGWRCWRAWIPTAPPRSFTGNTRSGLRARPTARPIAPGDRYVACIFTEYYDEFLTGVLTRDHRTLSPGRLYRQQLERAGPRRDLLLRHLPRPLPRRVRLRSAHRRRLGQPRLSRLDSLEL